jgi:dihydroorotase
MSDAGAVMFSNGDKPITNARIMRRILSYSASFNALIAHRPIEPSLADDGVMHEGDLSARLGLTGVPAAAERITAERDIALAELTGGRLLIDMISAESTVDVIRHAKSRDLDLACSVSFNNLCLNDLDIGDYRSFAKLSPPLREERDRQALIAGINDGTIDVIVSAHNPQGAGRKRLPFAEASYGAVGLELMLSAGLTLTHDDKLQLMAFLRALTIAPAQILGLDSGHITEGATADLVIIDPNRPWMVDNQKLRSRSKNTPFDRRRLTGRAVKTIINGEIVFDLDS